ncbi:AEC family transporter [Corynebacterium pseudotuberculosis]|uniref:AEC family transporter n=1 Tax=Corynebacterium pseudotuberculosis (strain C231) TaxID=681645 RepID=D9QBT8_CORP2|nr:AEC family transporter [Corynebacterium pseudotuberculosis]ADK29350.1 AEC family transporter [Corynebacterium pseudotuberculosis FRC41]ADL11014.1 AEC family transporter [Corynebacterium pseudotuberculosis C231]ADL21418.1 AEC family transporter [Corynebacterium pseudotuberculosis 1002]ADO26813.1 AEC family transporter [Corynebacterium pseudotuberculosis I19]AEK92878.1 Auxin Efflux Carrier [Corynebacterium pseudotuberculosis PAT10]
MESIFRGFFVIFLVIGLGAVLGKKNALGKGAANSLGNFVYVVATPALLLDKIMHTELSAIFSANFMVVCTSAMGVAFLSFTISRVFLRRRTDASIIGALSASYANGGNLGIPIATYVLDDATIIIPLMLFQIAFYAPLTMTWLDFLHNKNRANFLLNLVQTPLRNTMFLASITGLTIVACGLRVPVALTEPVRLIGDSSVPLALILFGMSLTTTFPRGETKVIDTIVACGLKNFAHPALAWGIASMMGVTGRELLVATFLGALPTAQNVYAYALRHGTSESLARNSGIVSTLVSLPTLIAIMYLLG